MNNAMGYAELNHFRAETKGTSTELSTTGTNKNYAKIKIMRFWVWLKINSNRKII